jgi:hypothetical protein
MLIKINLHLACSCNGKNDCMYRFACVDIVETLLKQNILKHVDMLKHQRKPKL